MALAFVGVVALLCVAYWLVLARPRRAYLSCWYYEFLSKQEEHDKEMQELDYKTGIILKEPQTPENIERLKEIMVHRIKIGEQYLEALEKIMKKNGITC